MRQWLPITSPIVRFLLGELENKQWRWLWSLCVREKWRSLFQWNHFSEWFRSVVFGKSLGKMEERQTRSFTLELETIGLCSRAIESLSVISVVQFHRSAIWQMSEGGVILVAAGDCRRGNRGHVNSNWGGENEGKENRIASRDIQLKSFQEKVLSATAFWKSAKARSISKEHGFRHF